MKLLIGIVLQLIIVSRVVGQKVYPEVDAFIDSIYNSELNQSEKLKEILKFDFFVKKQDVNKSLYINQQGIKLAKEVKDSALIFSFFYNSVGYYLQQNLIDSAILILDEGAQYIPKQDTTFRKFDYWTKKADLFRIQLAYNKAIEMYNLILDSPEIEKSTYALISAYFGLSALFSQQKIFDKGILYSKQVFKVLQGNHQLDNQKVLRIKVFGYTRLAQSFANKNQVDSTIHYGLKALELIDERNDRGLVVINYTLGLAFGKIGKPKKAYDYISRSLKNARKINSKHHIIQGLIALGQYYCKEEQNYRKVKPILDELKTLISFDKQSLNLRNYYTLSQLYYKGVNNYKLAYDNVVLNTIVNDTLRNRQNNKDLFNIETKYKTQKYKNEKDSALFRKRIAEETAKNERVEKRLANDRASRSETIALIIGISAILILGLLWFVFIKLKTIRTQKTALDIAYDKLELAKENQLAAYKLKVLKSQMNPHFIFNSLNSIQDLVLQQQVDKSYDYLVVFSDLVRSTLSYSDKEFISIDKELNFLEVYLRLEKLRFGDAFQYEIIYNGSMELKVPSLLIQPFIENALLHGLMHKKGDKELSIKFEVSDRLICTIKDNGIGRVKAKAIKERQGVLYESFSTEAMGQRLKILSAQYDMEATFNYLDLETDGKPSGTMVYIYMPYQSF